MFYDVTVRASAEGITHISHHCKLQPVDLPQHKTLLSLKYFYNLELILASCEIFTDYVGTAEVWTIVADFY